MKKKGNGCYYIRQRNENLKREFLARLAINGRNISDAIKALTLVPADRFYISEERAESEIRKAWKNNAGPKAPRRGLSNPRRQAMIKEIMRRVEVLMRRNPGLSLKDAVFEVVNSPAPSFYLTGGTIRTILYSNLK